MNLLIVDDEYYTVESLRIKMTEKCPQFDRIFCAYYIKHAMEYFSQYEIAVMICDIEMPGGSGLELLEQIRRLQLHTVCIFLTAYAKFDYISKAMKLSSSDYLLKPVDDEQLLPAVNKACAQYEHLKKDIQNTLYADYWKESARYLIEQFWQDMLAHTITQNREDIESELRFRKLDMTYASKTYILLMIQCNLTPLALPDKGLYEFAMKNIAREYFYREEEQAVIVRISEQIYILPLIADNRSQAQVVARCNEALTDFVPHFPYAFNFFVADRAYPMEETEIPYTALMAEVRSNVALENHVFDLASPARSENDPEKLQIPQKHWADLILQNKIDVLQTEVFNYLKRLKSSGTARRESLKSFYYSFLQLLFDTLEKKQDESVRLFHEQLSQTSPDEPYASFEKMKHWVSVTLSIYENSIVRSGESGVVAMVKEYIQNHLYDELGRDMLAASVYLNPDYLSHIFRKETGSSLTNYIIDKRIQKAKLLLAQNEMSIRDIAIACGFQNISYFSRQFKKSTGMTPREFRK